MKNLTLTCLVRGYNVARESENHQSILGFRAWRLKLTSSTINGQSIVVRGVRDFCDNEAKMIDGAFFKKKRGRG